MNIDNLRPAWQQFKIQHSLSELSQDEILEMVMAKEEQVSNKFQKLYNHFAWLLILLICQGG
ncbi:MAG: hypothetical protein RJQ09_05905 [Cyclobacteriaceae bacterium]